MQKYKISYAGLPKSKTEISAVAPKLAALKFFSQSPCRNTIIVKTGFLREEIFSAEQMIEKIEGVNIEDIPLKIRKEEPPKKIGLIQEFFNHVVLGDHHSWK